MNHLLSKILSGFVLLLVCYQITIAQIWNSTGILPPSSRYDDVNFINEHERNCKLGEDVIFAVNFYEHHFIGQQQVSEYYK